MSRAAVLDALRADAELTAIVPADNIIANYSKEGRPSNLSPGGIIVLRWLGKTVDPAVSRGPRELQLWAHWPEELSTDYNKIDKIISLGRRVIVNLEDVTGADGVTLVCTKFTGESDDLKDVGFATIARYATFNVLSRAT